MTKSQRIDLGLAILSTLAQRGEPLTQRDIAAWCDCEDEAIRKIEAKAMEKLQRALKREKTAI